MEALKCKLLKSITLLGLTFLFLSNYYCVFGQKESLIFPFPQEIETTEENFSLTEDVVILVPEYSSQSDLKMAHSLVRELSDLYGIALNIMRTDKIPDDGENYIVIGSIDNPLVRSYCEKNNTELSVDNPGKDGYVLQVKNNIVLIAGWDEKGTFYGLQSLRQLIQNHKNFVLTGINVRDWPVMPFRGIRLYIPGPENILFFKRFLRDFMALYKFNKVIIEVNCMRLNRHPEVNAGWIEFSKYMKYSRTSELRGIHGQGRNSGHQDAGDGFIIEQEDVKSIVDFARDNYIEVIPEIPSLTHAYYLLTRHPELAEYSADIWPDTYCPSNPKSYKLMFDVFDEYIEVINPEMIHIGHDEWWGAPLDVCPNCKGKDYSVLFAEDINKLYNYLTKRNIKVAMWGDFLLESVRGKGPNEHKTSTGFKYKTPGGLKPEVVKELIPKDILIFNWFWTEQEKDMELQRFGFKQLYGNFTPNITNWNERIKDIDLIGGAPSVWVSTNEFTIGKDQLYDFLGCANLLWSGKSIQRSNLTKFVWEQIPLIRRSLRGYYTPADDGETVVPIDISSNFNLKSNTNYLGINISTLKSGSLRVGNSIFDLNKFDLKSKNSLIAVGIKGEDKSPLKNQAKVIELNEDVSSLIFLHACALPASNRKSYYQIFNTFDTSDLLGWYEVVYEDGYKEIIPIQYGVNILEWNTMDITYSEHKNIRRRRGSSYCYEADLVNCSSEEQNSPVYFFAYEWINKRFGKKIKEVNLFGSSDFQSVQPVFSHVVTKPLSNNAIMLLGVSKTSAKSVLTNK